MAKTASGNGLRAGGIIIQQRKGDDLLGVAFQTARSAAPTSSADSVLYRRGTGIYWWDGSSETQLGAAGGGSGATLDSAYNAGASITIDTSTITLTQSLNDTGLN